MTESDLQKMCVSWTRLQLPDLWFWATPNEGKMTPRYGSHRKKMGVLAGVPDLTFVLRNGLVVFIELKSPTGRLSPPQKAFQARCETEEIPYFVIRSFDEYIRTVRGFATC